MATFEQGQSGNPAGRPKGSLNKLNAKAHEAMQRALDALDATLLEDLAKMKPERRVELWAQLQEFIHPKLSRTTLAGDDDAPLRGIVQVEVVGTVRPPTTSEKDVPD